MENYIYKLREHHLKATPQRAAIAEALDIYGHLSIDELYELLKKKFNSLSLATIYKNINIMIDNAFVSEVKLPHQKSVYELTKEAHSHFLCNKCNSVVDISVDLEDVILEAKEKSNFEINSVSLVFAGICEKCKS
jgi:Fur family peroxide stress response transcriptional regulator